MTHPDGTPDIGLCCICETAGPKVRNLIMLPVKSPSPGRGWGCLECGLPADGATAAICDNCHQTHHDDIGGALRFFHRGRAGEDGLLPIGEMSEEQHLHDMARHSDEWIIELRDRKGKVLDRAQAGREAVEKLYSEGRDAAWYDGASDTLRRFRMLGLDRPGLLVYIERQHD